MRACCIGSSGFFWRTRSVLVLAKGDSLCFSRVRVPVLTGLLGPLMTMNTRTYHAFDNKYHGLILGRMFVSQWRVYISSSVPELHVACWHRTLIIVWNILPWLFKNFNIVFFHVPVDG